MNKKTTTACSGTESNLNTLKTTEICNKMPNETNGFAEKIKIASIPSLNETLADEDGQKSTTSGQSATTMDGTSGITFEKIPISKQRAQSLQSVLSSMSIKSVLRQNNPQKYHLQQQLTQYQLNKSHIQAPATAATNDRRRSFEIGQKLEFSNDINESNDNCMSVNIKNDDKVKVSSQNNLFMEHKPNESTLFSKFQPAKVDMSLNSNSYNSINQMYPENTSIVPLDYIYHEKFNHDSYMKKPKRFNAEQRILKEACSTHSEYRNETSNNNYEDCHSQANLSNEPDTLFNNKSNSINSFVKMHPPESNSLPSTCTVSLVTNLNLKTINDPKRPMYVPAVLRQSTTNIKQENNVQATDYYWYEQEGTFKKPAYLYSTQYSWNFFFDFSNKLPTSEHWLRDSSRKACAFCARSFTFFKRRHHCRRCGEIFCAEHTSHTLKLGKDAQFTIGGSGVRCKVCDNCVKDYEQFVRSAFGNNTVKRTTTRMAQDSSPNSTDSNTNSGNVPVNWSWSSF